MDHDARKTVGNDTGRSLHLCPVGNGLCAIPILLDIDGMSKKETFIFFLTFDKF